MRNRLLPYVLALLLCSIPVHAEQVVEGFSLPINDELIEMRDGVYQGAHHDPLDYNKVEALYNLEITSDPTPAAQKMEKFGAGLRQLPMQVVHTRYTPARVGNWPALVIDGSALTPDQQSARVLSVVVVTDDKAYRFTQVSKYEHDTMAAKLGDFGLGDQKLTDYPTDLRGEYRLKGAPFGVVWSGYPYIHGLNKDTSYAVSYDASAAGLPSGVHIQYFLRQLKPDDKRTDAELFYELASKTLFTQGMDPEQFASPIVENELSDWSCRFSFKRKGDWVAVLARGWPPDKPLPVDAELAD